MPGKGVATHFPPILKLFANLPNVPYFSFNLVNSNLSKKNNIKDYILLNYELVANN